MNNEACPVADLVPGDVIIFGGGPALVIKVQFNALEHSAKIITLYRGCVITWPWQPIENSYVILTREQ